MAEDWAVKVAKSSCRDPLISTLPSPSRPTMMPTDRTSLMAPSGATSDFDGMGDDFFFQATGAPIREGPYDYANPVTSGSESSFGRGLGPDLGLGFGLQPGAAPWVPLQRPQPQEPFRAPARSALSESERLRAELQRRERWLDTREAELRAEGEEMERQKKSLRGKAENVKGFADRIRSTMQDNEAREHQIEQKQHSLFEREQGIKDFEEKVNVDMQEFQARRRQKEEEHQDVQRQLGELQQKDELCESRVNAVKGTAERLRLAEQEVEVRSKEFEEDKRKRENLNAIYKTEIRRLNQKLEQTQKIIPVGHSGGGCVVSPPELPPNISNLPTQNALPPVPFTPPPPAAAPSNGYGREPPAAAPVERVRPRAPAGRGQILDASWGPPPAVPPSAGPAVPAVAVPAVAVPAVPPPCPPPPVPSLH